MKPLVIAHRGASGRELENTLAAFRLARELGADAVELDVHATADGHLVVHHDEMIGRHHVAQCSFAEVQAHRLRNGEPVPTLEQALDIILPHMIAFVEVKALGFRWDEALLAAIDRSPAPAKVAVHSFDHRIVARLGTLRPQLPRGVLSASYPIHPEHMMEDAGAQALWQHESLIDAPLVASVHGAGGAVYAWTVDAPRRMQQLLELGVDGLCSNHPDRARLAIDSPR